VRGIDDFSRSPWNHLLETVEPRSVLDLTAADLDGVDAVVHLAAHKSVPGSFLDRRQMARNVEVDRHVLELVRERQVARLLMASSCEVYGNQVGLLDEARDRMPHSPYAVGKVTTEMLAAALAPLTATEVCCIRLFNTYGPGEGLDAVVPRFVHDTIASGRVRVEGSGRQRRYFSYIEPVVDVIVRLLGADTVPPVLNVAAGHELSVLDLAELLAEIVGPFEIEHTDTRPNEIDGFVPDLSLLESVIGPTPPTAIEHGLAACLAWRRHELADETSELLQRAAS
jgi:dTDP-glucose 4,6-dehydratase/UDP-glucose 4-epimerase